MSKIQLLVLTMTWETCVHFVYTFTPLTHLKEKGLSGFTNPETVGVAWWMSTACQGSAFDY